MKKVLLASFCALVVVVSLFSRVEEPAVFLTNVRHEESKIFLPAVYVRPCSKNIDQAWMASVYAQSIEDFCGELFYNSSWYNGLRVPQYIASGGLPILWSDIDNYGRNFYALGHTALGRDYTGNILVMNECFSPGQCNRTAVEAAVIFRTFERMFPKACLIGPQFHTRAVERYMQRVLDAYLEIYGKPMRPCKWAYHVYVENPGNLGYLDLFCDVLERNGHECSGIWITEFGTCTPEMLPSLLDLLYNDKRVERMFIFAAYIPERVGYSCYTLLDDDGNFTELGQIFWRYVH